jgi:hypothetical protein
MCINYEQRALARAGEATVLASAPAATLVAPTAAPAPDHHAHAVMAVVPAARSPSAARSAGHSALGRLPHAPQLAHACCARRVDRARPRSPRWPRLPCRLRRRPRQSSSHAGGSLHTLATQTALAVLARAYLPLVGDVEKTRL